MPTVPTSHHGPGAALAGNAIDAVAGGPTPRCWLTSVND